jgi:hypothetical protein
VSEQNKALIRRWIEEVQKGNVDVTDEVLAPDFVDHSLLPGQSFTALWVARSRKSGARVTRLACCASWRQLPSGDARRRPARPDRLECCLTMSRWRMRACLAAC